jgi:hypothetical protein
MSLSPSVTESLSLTHVNSPTVSLRPVVSPVAVIVQSELEGPDGRSITESETVTMQPTNQPRESNVRVPSFVAYRSIIYVEVPVHEPPTPLITEPPNAVIIGVSSSFGLIIAILLGTGVFLYRKIRHPDETFYEGVRRTWKWVVTPKEVVVDEFENPLTGNFDDATVGIDDGEIGDVAQAEVVQGDEIWI